jgi:hypothetical protein
MTKKNEIIPLSEVMPLLKGGRASFTIRGQHINKTDTLRMIANKGICCHYCKREAIGFKLLKTGGKQPSTHLRLMFDKKDYMTRDHVLAIAFGGEKGPQNVVPACSKCNGEKGCDLVPQSDWAVRMTYTAYMRWYIKTECKDLLHQYWHRKGLQKVFDVVSQVFQSWGDYDHSAFIESCYELIRSIPTPNNNTYNRPVLELLS